MASSYNSPDYLRDFYKRYNAMSKDQKGQWNALEDAYNRDSYSAGQNAYNDSQIGSGGAGLGMYEYMRGNGERQYANSSQGVMNRIMQQQVTNQGAAAPAAEDSAYNAGQDMWGSWKSPTDTYNQEVQALYANSPQANPQARVAGRVAAPSRFAGATGIYSRV
jgi:hypothetical protein